MGRGKFKSGLLWGTSFGAVLFSFFGAQASLGEVRINEVYPHPFAGEEEWIELKNFGDEEADISGWEIKDAGNHKYLIPSGTILSAGGVIIFEKNFYLNNSGSETVFLINLSGIEEDGVSFDGENKQQGFSWSFLKSGWEWTTPSKNADNWAEGEEEPPPPPISVEYPTEIRLNEILPNPSGNESEEEYIEIYNYFKERIGLESWKLKDSSKNGEYVFPIGINIDAGEYLTIYREDFSFALNNSNESVSLLNPEDELVSKISFSGSAEEDISYGFFKEKEWRWSALLTPGEINQFEEFPKYGVDLPKKVFKNAYAEFEVDIDDDDVKVKWDFGDQRTSTQRKVKHKYARLGKFKVSLTMTGKSETVREEFQIDVEKFENEDIEIVALLPNPPGADMDGEWVEIKNNGKKKTDLSGWSLATGSSNLYNHPIGEKFIIKSGKSERLYRDDCAFSLGNESSKVELRYPDGETADSVRYEKEKIEEGAIYRKIGKKWAWEGGGIEDMENAKDTDDNQSAESVENIEDNEIIQGIQDVEDVEVVEYQKLFTKNFKGQENKKKYLLGEKNNLSEELEEKISSFQGPIFHKATLYCFVPEISHKHWLIEWFFDANYLFSKLF